MRFGPRSFGDVQCFGHRYRHGMKLAVAPDRLVEPAAFVVLENNEIPHEVAEVLLLEHPLQQHFELRDADILDLLSPDRPPGLEPFAPRGERPRRGSSPSQIISSS